MTEIRIEKARWDVDQQALIAIRTEVFVEEQKVPAELEIDGLDAECQHVKALSPDNRIIGTARLLPSHYVGRMCVHRDWRKQGVGGRMLQYFIDHARAQHYPALMLNAQVSALPFYQRYGFVADSDIFLEADIEHRHMTLQLAE